MYVFVYMPVKFIAVVFCVALDLRLDLFVSSDFFLRHASSLVYRVKQDVFDVLTKSQSFDSININKNIY